MYGLTKAIIVAMAITADFFVIRKLWRIAQSMDENFAERDPVDKKGYPPRFYTTEYRQPPVYNKTKRWIEYLLGLMVDVLFFRQPGTRAGECNSQKKTDLVKKRWNLFTFRSNDCEPPPLFWGSLEACWMIASILYLLGIWYIATFYIVKITLWLTESL